MFGWKHYHSPSSIDEALSLLARYQGQAEVIAGGTDLILELRHGNHSPVEALVDVTHIPELVGINSSPGESVTIGAAVTHTQIVQSGLLARRATCLVESCGVVGGPQVRNVGTLGGNVAHALPAADGTVSLVALDASVEIVQQGERRWVNIREMFRGPRESLLDPTHDLLLRFRFKLCGPGEATAFKRIMRPQGVALPILGCAVWLKLNSEGVIDEARVCISPVAPTPSRLAQTEVVLRGAAVDTQESLAVAVDQAVSTLRGEIDPRTSKYRATAEYRREMAEVLLRSALPLAVLRARTGEAVPEGIGLE
jgi:carbon-monoxide dehydrogenase medium subunit